MSDKVVGKIFVTSFRKNGWDIEPISGGCSG